MLSVYPAIFYTEESGGYSVVFPDLNHLYTGGDDMQEDGNLNPEFWEILDMYERKFQEAAEKTSLPDQPDMGRIGAFVEHVNRYAVMLDEMER